MHLLSPNITVNLADCIEICLRDLFEFLHTVLAQWAAICWRRTLHQDVLLQKNDCTASDTYIQSQYVGIRIGIDDAATPSTIRGLCTLAA